MIEAIADLPDTELVVVGGTAEFDDADVNRLMRCAAEHSVDDRVTFGRSLPPGATAEVLAEADAVAYLPWSDPRGIAPLKAMAAGTAVVTSAVGAMLDIVVPGATGELVAPGEPAALAGVLRELLSDEARLASYARAGRQRARDRHQWSHAARDTELLYRRVLAKHEHPGRVRVRGTATV